VGIGIRQAWDNLLKGVSGVGPITKFDASPLPTRIAAEVKGFNSADWMHPKETRRSDLFVHYGIAATKMALDDAGLVIDDSNAERIGVNVGSGIGGLPMIEDNIREMIAKGPRRLSPFFVPGSIINMVAGLISIQFGAKGPNVSMVSACTTSSHAIGEAARMIEYGDADVMIAGGAEAGIGEIPVAAFAAMRALSTKRNDDPSRASRPFDADRDGFVMADGAGVLVLEALDHAQARGARIHAELVGYAATDDASHITLPAPGGRGAAGSMTRAIADAELTIDDIDYINAHGTSTGPNDKSETAAIKTVFGERAYAIPVSSTKSMTGHLLGAGGGVEAIACIRAIGEGCIPPTINYEFPDPECDLDYVPNQARRAEVNVAMSNSFGFGGHNATLIFRRYEPDAPA